MSRNGHISRRQGFKAQYLVKFCPVTFAEVIVTLRFTGLKLYPAIEGVMV